MISNKKCIKKVTMRCTSNYHGTSLEVIQEQGTTNLHPALGLLILIPCKPFQSLSLTMEKLALRYISLKTLLDQTVQLTHICLQVLVTKLNLHLECALLDTLKHSSSRTAVNNSSLFTVLPVKTFLGPLQSSTASYWQELDQYLEYMILAKRNFSESRKTKTFPRQSSE